MSHNFRHFRGVGRLPTSMPRGTFPGVSVARRIRQAGLFAGLAALTALACGSDTISLLPVPSASGGSAGQAATAGSSNGGEATPSAGRNNDGGSRNGSGAGRGGNGNVGGNVDQAGALSFGGSLCNGQSCAGGFNGAGNPSGFGGGTCVAGIDNCTPCGPNGQCPMDMRCGTSKQTKNRCVWCVEDADCDHGMSCDIATGRCAPPCRSSEDCQADRICDMASGVCVQCASSNDCERTRPDLPVCHAHRCYECEFADDCTGPGLGFCIGYRCIECFTKEDCGGRFCEDNRCR
jgi:hypothetical protein